MPKISQSLIDRCSAGPSATKTTAAKNLHRTIRSILGTTLWDTFLQGSYRNGTATARINDVDIVALRHLRSGRQSAGMWEEFFEKVANDVGASPRITGVVKKGDKCVTLTTASLNADIVPAVPSGDADKDPISIYSRRAKRERPNYPRDHYTNGSLKNLVTSQTFKPTVRLFKRWGSQYSNSATVSPSFYIECAVHAVNFERFDSYLPLGFAQVALEICDWSTNKVIKSVAGDKDILMPGEWEPKNFVAFQQRLLSDLNYLVKALNATTSHDANHYWRLAFGDT